MYLFITVNSTDVKIAEPFLLLVDHLPPALQHVPHPVPLPDPLQTRADPPLVPRQPHRLVVADLIETKNIFTTNNKNLALTSAAKSLVTQVEEPGRTVYRSSSVPLMCD